VVIEAGSTMHKKDPGARRLYRASQASNPVSGVS
jgi:hypothetical protein